MCSTLSVDGGAHRLHHTGRQFDGSTRPAGTTGAITPVTAVAAVAAIATPTARAIPS